jgi:hypothetical protein
MKLVAGNSDSEIERRQSLLRLVHRTLQEGTANLMRVVRGSGDPHEVVGHIQAFASSLVDHQNQTGKPVSADEFSAALSVSTDAELISRLGGDEVEHLQETDAVVRGALQVAASRILRQRTHEGLGRAEMHERMRAIMRIQEEAAKRALAAKTC